MIGEKMVSFWRGKYIFINRGPDVDVVVVLIDVDAPHDVWCEPNRQPVSQTDRRMKRNRVDTQLDKVPAYGSNHQIIIFTAFYYLPRQ